VKGKPARGRKRRHYEWCHGEKWPETVNRDDGARL